ncbi:MAG TPA: DUF2520 domain-containing protein [Candidatus Kapabacteria bacterium]|nr:DUF2520 domain-containing protein [Candidatus Kapabacteria bacterium]
MLHNISLIGAGKLGASLAIELNKYNLLNSILIRSYDKRKSIAEKLPENKIIHSLRELDINIIDCVILAIPDSAIEEVANDISQLFKDKLKNKYIIHCSGKERLDVLKSCAEYGAFVASAHPYQTFFKYNENLFKDVPWLIETENFDELAELILLLGGKPFQLSEEELEKKPLYHCSAVVASNLLASTITLSKQMLKEFENIDPSILKKIVYTTIENCIDDSDDNLLPMTGPLIRADLKTIAGHIEQLKPNVHLLESYKALCISGLEMLFYLNKISEENYNKLKCFLESK